MKQLLLYLALIFSTSFNPITNLPAKKEANSTFALLVEPSKKEVVQALKNGECQFNNINLFGKVKFVDAFEDIKIKYVDAFEDINVQFVDAFPNECGKWQKVDVFPDFKVKVVTAFEDITVKQVKSFPGVD